MQSKKHMSFNPDGVIIKSSLPVAYDIKSQVGKIFDNTNGLSNKN